MECMRATLADRQELLEFANKTFSTVDKQADFAAHLPQLYGAGAHVEDRHLIIKENGEIAAMLAAIPQTMHLCGEDLQAISVGTVCTAPEHRGKGYMRVLMKEAICLAKDENADLMLLAGQRQRYRHFGFEPGGIRLDFALTWQSLADIDTMKYTAISFEEAKQAQIDLAYALHQSGQAYMQRSLAQFEATCRSRNMQPFILQNDNGFIGYLCYDEKKSLIGEFTLLDFTYLPCVLKTFMLSYNKDIIYLSAAPFEVEKITAIQKCYDNLTVRESASIHLLNIPKTVQVLLHQKSAYQELQPGRFSFRTEDNSGFSIIVEENNISVEEFTMPHSSKLLSACDIGEAFFSPLTQVCPIPWMPPCASSWFPLPLYWSLLDNV